MLRLKSQPAVKPGSTGILRVLSKYTVLAAVQAAVEGSHQHGTVASGGEGAHTVRLHTRIDGQRDAAGARHPTIMKIATTRRMFMTPLLKSASGEAIASRSFA